MNTAVLHMADNLFDRTAGGQDDYFLQEILGKKIAKMKDSGERDHGGQPFFLNDLIGARVTLKGKRIGKLKDIIIIESAAIPEVSKLVVHRPWGYPSLLIPWEKVLSLQLKEISVDLEKVEKYEGKPQDGMVLLKDHVLDKKVLDVEGHEVEVVYDIRLVLHDGKLFVSDVDFSRYGFLRRIGLRGLANAIYKAADKLKHQTTSWAYIQSLPTNMGSFKGDVRLKVLKEKLAEMPPVDLADIIEALGHDQRIALFSQLDTSTASDTLEEIDPTVQRDLIAGLKKEQVAKLLSEMTSGQAADVLAALPVTEAEAILPHIRQEHQEKIRSILAREAEGIAGFITTRFLKTDPERTVGQAKEEYRQAAKDKVVTMYLYLVDEHDALLGVVDIKELLLSDDAQLLKEIMTEKVVVIKPTTTLRTASDLFEHYGFHAIPVTDDDGKIVGVLPSRDVMELHHHFID